MFDIFFPAASVPNVVQWNLKYIVSLGYYLKPGKHIHHTDISFPCGLTAHVWSDCSSVQPGNHIPHMDISYPCGLTDDVW